MGEPRGELSPWRKGRSVGERKTGHMGIVTTSLRNVDLWVSDPYSVTKWMNHYSHWRKRMGKGEKVQVLLQNHSVLKNGEEMFLWHCRDREMAPFSVSLGQGLALSRHSSCFSFPVSLLH